MVVTNVQILSPWKLAQGSGNMSKVSLILDNLVIIIVAAFQETQCSSLEVYVKMMILILKS